MFSLLMLSVLTFQSTSDPDLLLFHAIRKGNLEEARSAIANGANVHFVHERRQVNVFSVAIERGDLKAVKLLAENGVDLWSGDDDGNTALHDAARNGYGPLVGFLMEQGVDFKALNRDGDHPLILAARSGRGPVVRQMIDQGVPVDLKGGHGQTALMSAVSSNMDPTIRILASAGANINHVDDRGTTPLALAPRSDTALLLFRKGAVLQPKGALSPLLVSIKRGNEETASLLLARGCDPNAVDESGWSCLMLAEFNQLELIAKQLKDKQAKLLDKKTNPLVAFMFAAATGDFETVQRHLERKDFDVNVTDESGSSALSWAARRGHLEMVRMLIEFGADVNATQSNGRTPLMEAVVAKSFAVTELLLQSGSKIDVELENGETAYGLAKQYGDAKIDALLRKSGARQIRKCNCPGRLRKDKEKERKKSQAAKTDAEKQD